MDVSATIRARSVFNRSRSVAGAVPITVWFPKHAKVATPAVVFFCLCPLPPLRDERSHVVDRNGLYLFRFVPVFAPDCSASRSLIPWFSRVLCPAPQDQYRAAPEGQS